MSRSTNQRSVQDAGEQIRRKHFHSLVRRILQTRIFHIRHETSTIQQSTTIVKNRVEYGKLQSNYLTKVRIDVKDDR